MITTLAKVIISVIGGHCDYSPRATHKTWLCHGPKNMCTGKPNISTETVRAQSCMYIHSQTVLSYCCYYYNLFI